MADDAWTAGQTVALAVAILAIAVLVLVLAWRRLTRRLTRHPARHRFAEDLPQYTGDGVRTSPFARPLADAHDLDWPRATTIELKLADRDAAPWQQPGSPVSKDWL